VKVVHYGSRKSAKFVRSYWKAELGVFRVELELHSSLLRKHCIEELNDLAAIGEAIYPKHIRFVDFDWRRLERHLGVKTDLRGKQVFAEARRQSDSMGRVASYLRGCGTVNIHRFLVPLPINGQIEEALKDWKSRFGRKASEKKGRG
jgi:hypothetical protein